MRKCDYCGREGTAPDVRGAKSAAVSIGNYRFAIDVNVTLCADCADELMARVMDELVLQLGMAVAR